jgi:hypothetical protein
VTDEQDIFSRRLLAAFLHLSKEQQDLIQKRMAKQGIGGGIKSGIARLVGIRTPSMLSDMLAGRVRGTRYRAQLGELLGVSESWLMGEDKEPPDWAVPPSEAYQRFCRRLRRAWAAKCGTPTIDPSDPSDDDSSSNRMWMAWLRDDERKHHADQEQSEIIIKALDLDESDADWLAAGRYERIGFELLQRFNLWLGLPPLTHPDMVRTGHRTVQTALAHQEWVERVIEERIDRYALPGDLFALVREALCTQRAKVLRERHSTLALDDCLELLWRQQLRREHGVRRPPVPAEFIVETGRTTWTDPRVINNRSRTRRKASAQGDG